MLKDELTRPEPVYHQHSRTISQTAPRPEVKGISYDKPVLVLICCMSVIRLIVAAGLEISNDEAYYWLYTQYLQWNYFDHPPVVAAWTWIFTGGLAIDNEIFLRLGSIAAGAISGWFIYKCGTQVHSSRAGWLAGLMYNASLYAGLTAGVYLMPDAPQMIFWTLAMWMIARIVHDDNGWFNWILFGIATGCCIMSKVHGSFIWIGMGLYAIAAKRSWFRNPRFYLALALTVLVTSPILFWNIANDFITYQFHTGRFDISAGGLDVTGFFKELTGQFLFNNSFVVVLIAMAMIAFLKTRGPLRPALTIYSLIGIPLMLILLFISFFGDTMIYWSGPAYISLIPIGAAWLAEKNHRLFPGVLRWALVGAVLTMFTWVGIVNLYPGTFGNRKALQLGRGDITLDQFGWEEAGQRFESLYRHETSKGIMPGGTPLVCFYWWGAHTEYYFARPAGLQMFGLGSAGKIHHYKWVNERRNPGRLHAAYAIIPSDEAIVDPQEFKKHFRFTELATTITIKRGGRPAHHFFVYRLKN